MKGLLRVFLFLSVFYYTAFPQWFPQNPTLSINSELTSAHFISQIVGFIVGKGGVILKTTDSGTTWVSQSSGTTNWLYAVSFADENTGTAVGNSGTIIRTTNGGATWISQSSGTTRFLLDVSIIDNNNGIAVGGDSYNDGGIILRTTNGGTTWSTILSTPYALNAVSFNNEDMAIIVGDHGTILSTTNGGTIWDPQSSGTVLNLYDLSFTDSLTGTSVGSNLANGANIILKTINGGTIWTPQLSGITTALHRVSFRETGEHPGLHKLAVQLLS